MLVYILVGIKRINIKLKTQFLMVFDFAALSICDPNKTKCGDAYQIFDNTEEKLLILALADGVGSCVCDWKASEMTAKSLSNISQKTKTKPIFLSG